MGLDYKAIFSRELEKIVMETLEEHGIEYIYEDELNEIVTDITLAEYWPCIQELRRTYKMPRATDGIRFRW